MSTLDACNRKAIWWFAEADGLKRIRWLISERIGRLALSKPQMEVVKAVRVLRPIVVEQPHQTKSELLSDPKADTTPLTSKCSKGARLAQTCRIQARLVSVMRVKEFIPSFSRDCLSSVEGRANEEPKKQLDLRTYIKQRFTAIRIKVHGYCLGTNP
ncbi:hypothetical protein RF11_04167 [Thelohanellus kitauei]|uniref:Uncharacterized protein n=1 Tax=Thelohanellus kitauei TaxID=669202 RepID=A0A0C2MRF6_THEKT|nr:hypothetical protein RF11_04167 [Thelohanellus kitauei]